MTDLSDNWDDFLKSIGNAAGDLAQNLFEDWRDEAREDAIEFAELAKEKLPKWTEALAQGHIDKAEFSLLVGSLEALARLNALKAKGLAKQRLEQFRVGLISIVIRAAFAVVGV
ncbi:MAG: hypothetical protein AB3N12_13475 [Ruegeria sp.]